MNLQHSLKTNFAYSVARTFLQLLFPLVTFPYVSRVLLPEGLGKIQFAQSVVSWFVILASLGVNAYGIREGARLRDDKKALGTFAKEIFAIHLVATVVAYVLFGIALFMVPKLAEYRTLLFVCSANILFTTLGIEWLYGALEEYRYITVRSAFFQFLSLVLLFALVRSPDDYVVYALIGVGANALSAVCNLILSAKYIDFRSRASLGLFKHLRPMLLLFGTTLAISLYTILDTTMLGFLAGNTEVGLYTAATKLTKIVVVLVSALPTVWLSRFSLYADRGEADVIAALFRKAAQCVLMVTLPAMCGLFVLGKPLVLLFCGSAYAGSIPVMQLITPIVVRNMTI